MSRRSLRLDDGLLDRSLPHSSASFSVGGSSWRSSSRSLKSRRSQRFSVSCSESLLGQTPRKAIGPSLLNSSVHSVASDASLLSSLLDESIQESTLVDSFWGLDQDVDPKESTIVAEQSTILSNTLIGSDGCCPEPAVQSLSGVYCKDCESDRKEPDPTYCSSSRDSEHRDSDTSTIYGRDRRRKSQKAGFSQSGMMSLKESTQQQLQPTASLCKAVGDVFRLLNRRWRHMTSSFLRTRFLLVLVLVPVPLLLLLSLCWLGPAGLSSILPAVNITEWRTEESDVPGLSSIYSLMSSQRQSAGGAVEQTGEVQTGSTPLYSPPPLPETPTGEPDTESVRLGMLEQSLAALWQHVEARGRWAEQRHGELLQLYSDLQQQRQLSGDGVEPWLSGLLDQQLSQLRGRLDHDRRRHEQIQQQDSLQQQKQTTRLDQLELKLQTLTARTEQLHWRQEAAATASASPATRPAAASVGVDRQSHDALLAEVSRLEAALEDVKRDVQGLVEHQDECGGLDGIQQRVLAQVREEVRALLYGNQLVVGGGASDDSAPPEPLFQWLSQQYVSGAELQAALASLERRLLQNISLQLQQHGGEEAGSEEAAQHGGEEAGSEEAALHAARAAVTQEEVQVIVTNALRLFAQDRTGQADYALESGGGSIVSTRCSETYESKAALLSLFGVPLWYFSQSPRVVIQPDVHPGNCWAFRGSTGFLVIRLSMLILPTSFSLEHLPKSLAPNGQLHSAPRDFNVYGLEDESQERGKLLGSYTYDKDGEALQTYSVTEENHQTFQIIEVQVLSNWGHQEYTCMYRFRVHGTPQS